MEIKETQHKALLSTCQVCVFQIFATEHISLYCLTVGTASSVPRMAHVRQAGN
jgi:hypothetical protein